MNSECWRGKTGTRGWLTWSYEEKTERAIQHDWKLVETRIPLRLGKPLPLIPFVFHGPRHSQPGVEKLPLTDVITVNLDHYRLDADYKHGIHFTALPTAWVSGFDKTTSLRIGSSSAWVTETPGATAGFLEFTGQGLTTFERAMDRDERLIAVLGSRLIESAKKVGETAQAIELRQSGENCILGNLAINVSASLTESLIENSEGCCFWGEGWMARRDEGDCNARERTAHFGKLNGWAWEAHTLYGSSTAEQRSQTALSAKTPRAAVLLSVSGVGSVVTARCGDAPLASPARTRRLGHRQNSSPQHPSEFSIRLFGAAVGLLVELDGEIPG